MKKHDKNSDKKSNDKLDPQSLHELTNSKIMEYLQNKLNSKMETRKDLDLLKSTVEEFLNSFIILGYTFEGEPINMMLCHNQQEADSLATLVNKVFIQNNSHRED